MIHIEIVEMTFEEIYPFWFHLLWPNRTSKIEPTSALSFDGSIDMNNMNQKAFFTGARIDGIVVGVNSVHPTAAESFRSRGLYILPEHRGKGIAQILLKEAKHIASSCGAHTLWSIPRQSSWKSYESVGFVTYTPWITKGMEFGPNAYALVPVDPNKHSSSLKPHSWQQP